MKKITAVLIAALIIVAVVSCSSGDKNKEVDGGSTDDGKYQIAMIAGVGTVNDRSFNQASWEGIVKYAEENGISHKYYKTTEKNTAAYLESIDLAVKGGAKIIVASGYSFEEAIYKAQDQYKSIKFVLIDGVPHSGDNRLYKTAANTVSIAFSEEQAGYLAGYGAVKEGYTKLGFMGGIEIPSVIRYGYGFIQGAEAAAAELGVTDLSIKYHYTGSFDPSAEVQTMADSWYQEGTQVIFAAAGPQGISVMKAAERESGKVIGVDVDQSSESDTVITSAMKGLDTALAQVLAEYKEGKFPGGQDLTMGAKEKGIQLAWDNSGFEKFTEEDYYKAYRKLVEGKIRLQKEEVTSPDKLKVRIAKIQFIK